MGPFSLAVHTISVAVCALALDSTSPAVLLQNAADPGVFMPITGCGSGGYTGNASQPYGAYPECFNGCQDPQCSVPNALNFSGCGEYVDAAVATWLQLGGRRIDNSASYHNQFYVGQAMAASGLARSDIFLTSKVGPYLPLGGLDALGQFNNIRQFANVEYVDLLLIHWPDCTSGGGCTGAGTESIDPLCNYNTTTYDPKGCRLSTWSALVDVWKSGGARAIGVSNYNITHLQEIIDAGMPLPAVNQCPFHLYHSQAQMELLAFCASHNITFNGYSPFGVPDRKTYAPPMASSELQDPVVLSIASTHGRSAAEIILAWEWQLGMVVNPRSQNAAHMMENLAFADIKLTAQEIAQLNTRPQA